MISTSQKDTIGYFLTLRPHIGILLCNGCLALFQGALPPLGSILPPEVPTNSYRWILRGSVIEC